MINQHTSTISLKAQRFQDTVVLNMKPTGHPTDADWKLLMVKILLKTFTKGSVMLAATPHAAKHVINRINAKRMLA